MCSDWTRTFPGKILTPDWSRTELGVVPARVFFNFVAVFAISERFRSILLQFLLQFFVLRVRLVRLSGGCSVLRTDPVGNRPEHFVAVFVAVFVLRVRLVRLSGGCSVLRMDPVGDQSVQTVGFFAPGEVR